MVVCVTSDVIAFAWCILGVESIEMMGGECDGVGHHLSMCFSQHLHLFGICCVCESFVVVFAVLASLSPPLWHAGHWERAELNQSAAQLSFR